MRVLLFSTPSNRLESKLQTIKTPKCKDNLVDWDGLSSDRITTRSDYHPIGQPPDQLPLDPTLNFYFNF
ncbi:hypothetical protein Hdeb2414_s0105g00795511 [Helianthus debilis subsp. tardiflorus]